MDNRLVIVDDFYARPDAVRARALASDYANIEPTDYPGFASRLVLEVDALRRVFSEVLGADLGCEHRMRATLSQRDHPGLRKRSLLTLVNPRPAEMSVVHGRVRHIETHPVDRDQPPPSQPHPRRLVRSDRPRDPLKQRLQRLSTQPGTGLENR